MDERPDIMRVGGFPVLRTTSSELAIFLLECIDKKNGFMLFFANTNFVVKCNFLASKMDSKPVIIVNDGVGIDLAALLLYRKCFKENLNGTDFLPYLFKQSRIPLRVYLLGAKPDVLNRAVAYLTHQFGQLVVGSRDGYQYLDDPELLNTINSAQPDIILVALGNPIQEEWILNNRDAISTPLIIGVGALFDFWAGDKPRAPRYLQKVRLEWLFRLMLEPRRLIRRYTIDILRFAFYCYKYKNTRNATSRY